MKRIGYDIDIEPESRFLLPEICRDAKKKLQAEVKQMGGTLEDFNVQSWETYLLLLSSDGELVKEEDGEFAFDFDCPIVRVRVSGYVREMEVRGGDDFGGL